MRNSTRNKAQAAAEPRKVPNLADFTDNPVHTMKCGAIRAALEQLPDWTAAADALTALDQTALPTLDDRAIRDEVTTHIVEGLKAGALKEDDVLDHAGRLTARHNAIPVAHAAVTHARRRLVGEMDAVVRANWTTIFTALSDEYSRVLERARTIANPRQLLDAESAIKLDRVDDFNAWHEVTALNAELRGAQATLLEARSLDGGHQSEAYYLKNVEKVFPDWVAWATAGGMNYTRSGVLDPVTPPWPVRKGRGTRQQGTDRFEVGYDDRDARFSDALGAAIAATPEFVLWALESGAEAWIPTAEQLRDESTRLAELVTAHQAAAVDPRDVGRYRTREDQPSGRYGDKAHA